MTIEWIAAAAVLLTALVVIRRRIPSRLANGVFLTVLATVISTAAVWATHLRRSSAERTALLEKTPQMGRPGGYVSSSSCLACHPSQYDSWHRSYHRTMTQYARPETVRGDFHDVTLHLAGDTFHLEQRGDEFWVEMTDPDWRYVRILQDAAFRAGRFPNPPAPEKNPPRSWKRVGMLTGSHHMQAYWVASDYGNMQFSLPLTYLFADRRWTARNDVFLLPPGSLHTHQVWNSNCLNCHATAGQMRQDPRTKLINSRVAELGIACEACHGPAEKHLLANAAPLHRYRQHGGDLSDPTIINPARLDHIKSSEICGQCHAVRVPKDLVVWNQEGNLYRPGGDAEANAPLLAIGSTEEFDRVNPKSRVMLEGTFWRDGQVRVSGRDFSALAASACYRRGQISCLSCHSLHRYEQPAHQMASNKTGNQGCLQCHTEIASRVEKHTHHRADSSGSLCYNCHMARTTYGLMGAIRSHTIHSPTVQESIALGRPNACNLCHLDRPLAWTASQLHTWFGQPIPSLTPEDSTTSAALLWLLRGDAGQRALVAWHAGWEPARQASGGDAWLAPFLAQLFEDPYSVVRYIAGHSLQQLPGFRDFAFDYIGPETSRREARLQVQEHWNQPSKTNRTAAAHLLLDAQGNIQKEKVLRYLSQRDDRALELLE